MGLLELSRYPLYLYSVKRDPLPILISDQPLVLPVGGDVVLSLIHI